MIFYNQESTTRSSNAQSNVTGVENSSAKSHSSWPWPWSTSFLAFLFDKHVWMLQNTHVASMIQLLWCSGNDKENIGDSCFSLERWHKLTFHCKRTFMCWICGHGRENSCEEMSPLTMAFARLALRGRLPMPLLGLCLGHQSLGVAEARRDDQGDGQWGLHMNWCCDDMWWYSLVPVASWTWWSILGLWTNVPSSEGRIFDWFQAFYNLIFKKLCRDQDKKKLLGCPVHINMKFYILRQHHSTNKNGEYIASVDNPTCSFPTSTPPCQGWKLSPSPLGPAHGVAEEFFCRFHWKIMLDVYIVHPFCVTDYTWCPQHNMRAHIGAIYMHSYR